VQTHWMRAYKDRYKKNQSRDRNSSLLHLECCFFNFNSQPMTWFSRSFCHVPLKRDHGIEVGDWDEMTLKMQQAVLAMPTYFCPRTSFEELRTKFKNIRKLQNKIKDKKNKLLRKEVDTTRLSLWGSLYKIQKYEEKHKDKTKNTKIEITMPGCVCSQLSF